MEQTRRDQEATRKEAEEEELRLAEALRSEQERRRQADEAARRTRDEQVVAEIPRRVLERAGINLYRDNPYRRLRLLPTDALPAEINGFLDDAGPPPTGIRGALPLAAPPPSDREINEVRHRLLADPIDRLLDAFLWFWPSEPGRGFAVEELRLLYAGEEKGAVAYWTDNRSAAARHNLALYHHVRILDHCCDILDRGNQAPPDRSQIEGAWRTALRSWRAALADDRLREWLDLWVARAKDPRLPGVSVVALLRAMPRALQQIDAAFALAWAERGFAGDPVAMALADDQTNLLWTEERWFGGAVEAVSSVARPLKERVDDAVKRARGRADSSVHDRRQFVGALLDGIAVPFRTMALLAGDRTELKTALLGGASNNLLYLLADLWPQPWDDTDCQRLGDWVALYQQMLELSLPAEQDAAARTYLANCKKYLRAALPGAWETLLPANGTPDLEALRAQILLPLRELMKASTQVEAAELGGQFASALFRVANRLEGGSDLQHAVETRQLADELLLNPETKKHNAEAIARLLETAERNSQRERVAAEQKRERERIAAVRAETVAKRLASFEDVTDLAARLDLANRSLLPELRALLAEFAATEPVQQLAKTAAGNLIALSDALAKERRFTLAVEACELAGELAQGRAAERSNWDAVARYRRERGERRTGECFFCRRRKAAPEHDRGVDLHSNANAANLTIWVPRCKQCQNFHEHAAIGLIAVPFAALLLARVWLDLSDQALTWLGIATLAGLFFNWARYKAAYFGGACSLVGTRPEDAALEYPEVADLRRRDWVANPQAASSRPPPSGS